MRTDLSALQRERGTPEQGVLHQSLAVEKDNSLWKYIFECGTAELKSYSRTAKNSAKKPKKFSLIFFHLCCEENVIGDRSAEVHLKNTKNTQDAYLGLSLSIFIKIAQSIW